MYKKIFLICGLSSIMSNFPMANMRDFFYSTQCEDGKVIEFVENQALLAGRKNGAKIFITKQQGACYSSMRPFADTIFGRRC